MRCLLHVIHLAALEVGFQAPRDHHHSGTQPCVFFQLLVKLRVLSNANMCSKDVAYQDLATEPAQ
jgi:hypothetical protein